MLFTAAILHDTWERTFSKFTHSPSAFLELLSACKSILLQLKVNKIMKVNT